MSPSDYRESAKTAAWLLREHPNVITIKCNRKTWAGQGSPKTRVCPESGDRVLDTADLRAWLDKRWPWWETEGIERDAYLFTTEAQEKAP